MQTLNIREVRGVLGHLETLLDVSGEIIITKRGEAIARIIPIQGKQKRPAHEELHRLTKKLKTPSEKLLRDLRDER